MNEPTLYLAGRISLYSDDSFDVLDSFIPNSFASCVTDPPYGLKFMGKSWDSASVEQRAFQILFWQKVLRVLKPGAHLIAFGGTRTYHRMACAIEDAGFEIRDLIAWMYGSGFPKSHDVAKGIDKSIGARTHDSVRFNAAGGGLESNGGSKFRSDNPHYVKPKAVTDLAAQWDGWGTALKPALEPICFARKPLGEKTIAANVLKHGTGAINVDGCRVGVRESPKITGPKHNGHEHNTYGAPSGGGKLLPDARWPANVVHDGSDEVVGAFPDTKSGELLAHHKKTGNGLCDSSTFAIRDRTGEAASVFGDSGSAARFFYSAKADADDRLGSKHPTVKPVGLMQWLVRLVTPPGGLVLDPFAGTGTTGEAAFREGLNAILIEREASYRADIARRMALCRAGPDERKRESIKAKHGTIAAGPLFGETLE